LNLFYVLAGKALHAGFNAARRRARVQVAKSKAVPDVNLDANSVAEAAKSTQRAANKIAGRTRAQNLAVRKLTGQSGAGISTATILYVLLSPRVMKPLYRPLLFHPAPFPAAVDENLPLALGVEPEECYFNSYGSLAPKETLHGWWFAHPHKKDAPVVLFSHGNSGNITIRTGLCELLMRSGASVFVYDYRGFGKSTGLPTVEGVSQDGVAAFDFLQERMGVKCDQLFLYGESLGAAVTTYIHSQRECAGMVLQSGFSSLRAIAGHSFAPLKVYPNWLFPHPGFDSEAILRRTEHPPLLVIHGKLDQVVPYAHGLALYEAASARKKLLALPATNHSDLLATAATQLHEELSSFFSKTAF
jgi:fermentation-respiration switch protein FrsA (DUF1100 family)